MRPDTEGLFDRLTTRGAFLRRVVRSHSNHLTPSTFSLGFKVVSEHPPGCIGYGKGQTMVANHVGHLQVFNGDDLIAIDIVAGRLMQRILALVGHALMVTSHMVLGFLRRWLPFLHLASLRCARASFLALFLGMLGILDNVPTAISNQIV